jgi:UDP-N-acetylmuramoyl-tripeptide--D-alanyl-D-alanine ligase
MGVDVLTKRQGTKILVLGDMGELGENTEKMHYNIGKSAKEAGVDRLFCLGKQGQHACAAFGEGADGFIKLDDLIAKLDPVIQKNTSILVKGSRAMKMERVVDAFSIKGEGV